MDIGFPELTDSFLEGQDIFYTQFNEVSFYVEDTDQEHLYFNILKRMFENVKFDKIFPLNGKDNLKNHARDNIGNKDKIYIADIDFEDILETKEELRNVFYLNNYSIENHLVDQKGLFEIIREKSPKLKNSDISNLFDLNTSLRQCKVILSELACTFIVIQKHSLGKEYFGLNPPRDIDFRYNPATVKNNFVSTYLSETEQLLKLQDGRFTLKSKQNTFKKHFNSLSKIVKNVPGKYLLNILKYQLEKAGLIVQLSLETFTYKLSKEGSIDSFELLKNEIIEYRK
ncbi:MAG: DUF4435 domain-containing protein [Flavobacteriales bacterium]|nr:DUF4435 domain-containing protein [Flavobacteriales bacterium]MCW8913389.1 DUF4435 domain-containing protein [Flavobacteriales bacterium]MCW8938547.1 DUF4435 domain-containing protein [Flavobacteriales bacterium]MCW8940687.1 DUF4435 domain-containing protein [Flavobacteriales bacterium]MCW8969466.1 DUF4435 domain-containing protein [Flavobacteriales bacterium]